MTATRTCGVVCSSPSNYVTGSKQCQVIAPLLCYVTMQKKRVLCFHKGKDPRLSAPALFDIRK